MSKFLKRFYLGIILVFLYIPIVVLIVQSFNAGKSRAKWEGFSLRWYEELGLESVTASYELAMSKIKALGGTKPLGIVAYGRLPLMHFRNCPVKASIGCAKCGGKGELTDRMNVKFPVECTEKKYSTMVNSVPLHIAERDMRGLDYAILYFTTESAGDCRRITEDYRLRRKGSGQRTGGLYYRELL